MNENENNNANPGFWEFLATEDGIHRAIASVAVAVVVASAKYAIFGGGR
jgi:hypothetical protein